MKRLVLLLLLWGISLSVASESESMACRATNLLRSGKFVKSYSQFEQALLASRKESDLQAEGRILIAMAQIRTQSLEFEFAGQLLSQVRKAALDSNGRVALLLAQISLLNAQNKYEEAVRLWTTEARTKYRNVPDLLLGSLYGEVAVAYAGYGDKQESQAKVETAEDYFSGDAPGKLNFIRARVAHLLGDKSADSLYTEAFQLSVKGDNSYMSATILYYKGLCAKSKTIANDYFLRSSNAFQLLGLPNNKTRSDNLRTDTKP